MKKGDRCHALYRRAYSKWKDASGLLFTEEQLHSHRHSELLALAGVPAAERLNWCWRAAATSSWGQ